MARYAVEVREMRTLDVKPDQVLTLTEVAAALGVSLDSVSKLWSRARDPLRRVIDQEESNPTKATRLLKSEVDAERKRRRGRRDDGRLKRAN
jgi:hypothetical protein